MPVEVKIREGYQAVMPYLVVNNAQAFLDFTKTVFGAAEIHKAYRNEQNLIQHAEISISGSVIMFADATETFAAHNASLFVYVADCDAVYEEALKQGANTITEPADQSYGRSCGVKDPFGNTWWITSVAGAG
jgi:PhnB protein